MGNSAFQGGLASIVNETSVVKPSDQTVTDSTTPTDDSALQFAVSANTTYLVDFYILYSGNNLTGDYAWQFTFPGTDGAAHVMGVYASPQVSGGGQVVGAIGNSSTVWPTPAPSGAGVDATDTIRTLFGRFLVRPTSSGTLKFQFCNVSAGAGRTSTTRATSRLVYSALT